MILLVFVVLYIENYKDWTYISDFNYINSIASSQRYTYFAGDNGIIMFDKLKEEWQTPQTRKLFPKNIKLIAYDEDDNSIWFATPNKIYKWTLTSEDYREILPITEIPLSIGISPQNIYLLYSDKKCTEINKFSFSYKDIDSIPKNVNWFPKASSNDYVWLSPYYVTDKFFNNYKMSCVSEDNDALWVGTYGYGVFKYNTTTRIAKHYFLGFPIGGVSPYGTQSTEKNYVWIASHNGIYKWDMQKNFYSEQKEMPSHFCSEVSAVINLDKKLLVGTYDGLLEYDKTLDRWEKIYTAPNKITSLCMYEDKILIGTENSLVELKNGDSEELLKNVYVNDIKFFYNQIWIATSNGVFFNNGNEWNEVIDPNKSLSWGVNKIEFYKDKIYFCSNQGLLVYSNNNWEKFTAPVYLPSNKTISVAIDSPIVWIGTDAGASKWNIENNSWKIYSEGNSPLHSPVHTILFDKEYVLFIMKDGLAKLKK